MTFIPPAARAAHTRGDGRVCVCVCISHPVPRSGFYLGEGDKGMFTPQEDTLPPHLFFLTLSFIEI